MVYLRSEVAWLVIDLPDRRSNSASFESRRCLVCARKSPASVVGASPGERHGLRSVSQTAAYGSRDAC